MTTQQFTLTKHGDLKALFYKATRNLEAAIHQERDFSGVLEAQAYLDWLFAEARRIRPQ